ncbi:MAG: putrescine ABC transporter permease PotH, partial [Methylobacteriaceae bacterium]|nr:putrescine ABC transporter permease PotH [Methylobacteriaceae bacterium]
MNTSPKLSARIARAVVPAIPCLWLLALFVTPFVIVLKMSLSDVAIAQPPYTPLFDFGALGEFLSGLDMENYEMLLGVPPLHFIHVLLLAVVVYGLGVPLALYIAVERGPRRAAVVL